MNTEIVIRRILFYVSYPILFVWAIYLLLCTATPPGTHIVWKIFTKTVETPVAAVFAAVLATAGWVTTAYVSRVNSVKQHTMQVLTQARLSVELNAKSRDLYDAYPSNSQVPLEDITNATGNEKWFRGAMYLLNYYEFLSVAIRYRDVHEKLLRDCVRSQLCATHDKLIHVIAHRRAQDSRVLLGKIKADQSRIYQDLLKRRLKWK